MFEDPPPDGAVLQIHGGLVSTNDPARRFALLAFKAQRIQFSSTHLNILRDESLLLGSNVLALLKVRNCLSEILGITARPLKAHLDTLLVLLGLCVLLPIFVRSFALRVDNLDVLVAEDASHGVVVDETLYLSLYFIVAMLASFDRRRLFNDRVDALHRRCGSFPLRTGNQNAAISCFSQSCGTGKASCRLSRQIVLAGTGDIPNLVVGVVGVHLFQAIFGQDRSLQALHPIGN
mmetsp:Transcript_1193/g.2655  ORF Transcript_1193/g.2655 Transcript_1193/m.2655 type:complete len:234 (+) Transcript_1193:128-829(+)